MFEAIYAYITDNLLIIILYTLRIKVWREKFGKFYQISKLYSSNMLYLHNYYQYFKAFAKLHFAKLIFKPGARGHLQPTHTCFLKLL